jgi:hypothetical protein
MHSRSLSALALVGLLAATSGSSLVGCQEQSPEPKVASAGSFSGYALEYPAEVERNGAAFAARKDELAQIDQKLPSYADQLKDPRSVALAITVVKKAEASGKAGAYVDRARESDGVNTFMDDEGPEIGRKVGGAAQYAAKQKECDVNAGGAAAGAIKPAVAKQIEKRTQKRNEAWVLIDRERASLPKDDVAVLEKIADDVARGSFLAYVELTTRKVKLRRLADEASDVKSANADYIEAEKSFQGEAGRSEADKKASDARIDAARKVAPQIDDAAGKLRELDKEKALDKQIAAAQNDFDAAVDALRSKLKAKKG